MQRQKPISQPMLRRCSPLDENDLEKAWDSLDVMDDYIQTSVTRSQYLGLVKTLKKAESQRQYRAASGNRPGGRPS